MLHGADTKMFMDMAYTACYNGAIVDIPNVEVRAEMIKVVMDDLCTAIRTLPPPQRGQFLTQVERRLAGGH